MGVRGPLSNLESGHAAPFLHRISVVHVYVCLNTETSTADLAGWDLHHLETVLHQLTAGNWRMNNPAFLLTETQVSSLKSKANSRPSPEVQSNIDTQWPAEVIYMYIIFFFIFLFNFYQFLLLSLSLILLCANPDVMTLS